MVRSGELRQLVADGVAGVTSDPTIFQQAIAKSSAYQDELARLASSPADDKTVFETLAIADIQAAADVLRPVYDAAGGHDGCVSLEVAPISPTIRLPRLPKDAASTRRSIGATS